MASKYRRERRQPSVLDSLLTLREGLARYWHALLEGTQHKDLVSDSVPCRSNIHLALTYHLVHIFVGRSFIFDKFGPQPSDEDSSDPWAEKRNRLVEGCIESALAVVGLCKSLHESQGLARGSYTESSTCCAALLALLAYRASSKIDTLESACKTGISFLQDLSTGIYSDNSEKAAVLVLESAVERLRHVTADEATRPSTVSTYAQFKTWLSARSHVESADYSHGSNQYLNHPLTLAQPTYDDHVRAPFLEQSEFEGLSIVPGLEDWFELSME